MSKQIFTTINTKAPNLKAHYKRLKTACKQVEITFDYSLEQFTKLVNEQLAQSQNNGLQIIVSDYHNMKFVSKQYSARCHNYKLKSQIEVEAREAKLKRYPNPKTYAKLEKAQSEGVSDYLYIVGNTVSETIIGNIYIIKDGKIYTPSLTNNILAGTIREYLVVNNYAIEKEISYEQLVTADCLFMTNSIKLIQVVSQLDDIKYTPTATNLALLKELNKELEQLK